MRRMRFTTIVFLYALVFVSALGAQCQPDQVILGGTSLGGGVAVGLNTSGNRTDWLSSDSGSLLMRYPAGQDWGSVFFSPGAAVPPSGRVGRDRDLSGCGGLVVELSGGPATVNIGIKDEKQADDGSETTIPLQVSGDFQTYTIPLSKFTGVDLKRVYILAEINFSGSQGQTVRVRSIRYAAGSATQILPQLAFGGGWYSAVYFANTTDQPVSFPLQTIGDDGRPLIVPALSSASVTVNLAARGSAVVGSQMSALLRRVTSPFSCRRVSFVMGSSVRAPPVAVLKRRLFLCRGRRRPRPR